MDFNDVVMVSIKPLEKTYMCITVMYVRVFCRVLFSEASIQNAS